MQVLVLSVFSICISEFMQIVFFFLQISLAPIVNQAYPYKNTIKKRSIKLLFMVWWLTSNILITFLQVTLFTSLIAQNESSVTVTELIQQGFFFQVSVK